MIIIKYVTVELQRRKLNSIKNPLNMNNIAFFQEF